MSERRACKALNVSRSVQRYQKRTPDDEEALQSDIIRLARKYGRYGYRRITALLKVEGWHVNHKRVERIWGEDGLKVPQKQRKKKRLYLIPPCWRNHVWSYDFVSERLANGRKIRLLTVIDEYTRQCLSIHVGYKLN